MAAIPAGSHPLLAVEGLSVEFRQQSGLFRKSTNFIAVDGVDLTLERGETLGIVGESGSGKTTIGRAVVRALMPSAGSIRFNGTDIAGLGFGALLPYRSRLQMVFQDPYSSLDPRRTIRESIEEPLRVHRLASGTALREKVMTLLQTVGLPPGAANRLPHQFSGGQLQRVGIARALAASPDLIVCDEPVSALDVSIQAQIVNLFKELQSGFDLAYLFIAHDLAVVRYLAHRVAVVYLGRIVEEGPTHELFASARHPYTQALLSAVPQPDVRAERGRRRIILRGDPPSLATRPLGCRFASRCWLYEKLGRPQRCVSDDPVLQGAGKVAAHRSACHFSDRSRSELTGQGG